MATFTATLDNLFGSTVQVRASLKMGEQLWGFFLVFSFPKNFSPAIDIHNLACASVCVCVCVHVYNTCSIDNEATNAQYPYYDNFHQLILHYTVHVRLLLHRIPSQPPPPPPPYTHTHTNPCISHLFLCYCPC